MARKVTCDENHIYHREDGVIVPGYSEIMADLGFGKNPYWTHSGREEGHALHYWFNFLARGKKSAQEPEPELAGRVEGIKLFLAETGFEIEDGEKPLYCEKYNYATTPDAWGWMGKSTVLVEVKRGAKLKSHRLQTAAQKIAMRENFCEVTKRYCLYLKDGGYSLDLHEDLASMLDWADIANCYHAKRRYS